GMKIPVKTGDDLHGFIGAVGDLIKVQIGGRDQFVAQQLLADVDVPRLPISAAGFVHEYQRHELALAGLHQRDGLVTFVQRAEPTGEQDNGVGVPDENQFAREKIFEGDELFILGDDGVRALFPRQADVDAKTVLQPRPFVAGLHDARTRAGDDHESGGDNFAPEFDGLLVFHAVRLGARRTEDGNLAFVRIRREQPERVAQFADRRLDDAHVAGVLHIGQQLERVFDDVGDFRFVIAAAFEFDEIINLEFEL